MKKLIMILLVTASSLSLNAQTCTAVAYKDSIFTIADTNLTVVKIQYDDLSIGEKTTISDFFTMLESKYGTQTYVGILENIKCYLLGSKNGYGNNFKYYYIDMTADEKLKYDAFLSLANSKL